MPFMKPYEKELKWSRASSGTEHFEKTVMGFNSWVNDLHRMIWPFTKEFRFGGIQKRLSNRAYPYILFGRQKLDLIVLCLHKLSGWRYKKRSMGYPLQFIEFGWLKLILI
uniref:Uncharacterized protein n=1 Tax=Opuntia streptacantha TaxID=393608 RepID=A0A7C9D913_OPUST